MSDEQLCGAKTRSGGTCKNRPVTGAVRCRMHGGKRKRVCARGPHGLGKTTLNSWIVLWFALTRDGVDPAIDLDWKCLQTAGVWRQLEKFLWPEIRKWRVRLRWDVIGREPFGEKTEAFFDVDALDDVEVVAGGWRQDSS